MAKSEAGIIAGRILPAGGAGIVGRSGSGKSSFFFGSEYVQDIFLADTGSQGHKIYHKGARNERGDPVAVVTVDYRSNIDPMDQVIQWVRNVSDAGRLWVLDSFTTIIQHQCVKVKGNKRQLYQEDYQAIVGKARDLALTLAQYPGFTVFNTSPGGKQKLADGTVMDTPTGSIIALPTLSGLTPGGETILARWTTAYCAFPGYVGDKDRRPIPRGFILPNKDIRSEAARFYSPIKDPLCILAETTAENPNGSGELIGLGVDAIGPPAGMAGHERPAVDLYLERIAAKFPERLVKGSAPPAAVGSPVGVGSVGIQSGRDLAAYVQKKDAELAKGKHHEAGTLVAALSQHGVDTWRNGEIVSWNEPEKIATALGIVTSYEKTAKEKKKNAAAA